MSKKLGWVLLGLLIGWVSSPIVYSDVNPESYKGLILQIINLTKMLKTNTDREIALLQNLDKNIAKVSHEKPLDPQ